jgi:tripartite-type tricarboxylate transporter receptor subunit TctC
VIGNTGDGIRFCVTTCAALAFGASLSCAQTYPTKPVRVIVAFAPGGAADVLGRVMASQLTQQLGQQFVVDNRAGAGGATGTEIVARAKPDGYTLLMFSSAHAIGPSLGKVPYDPLRDFVPIVRIGVAPSTLVVHPQVAKTVKELVTLAKQQPGKLNFTSAGIGSFTHVSTELFRSLAGIDIVIVQYKGAGPATIDVIGGHAQATISTLSAFLPHIQSGRVRVLGIGSAVRSALLPDVPTIAEAGVPGYDSSSWFGMAAPTGTPQPVIDKVHKALATAFSTAETRKLLLDQGAEPGLMGPSEFGAFYRAELAKWSRVIKDAKIRAE